MQKIQISYTQAPKRDARAVYLQQVAELYQLKTKV